MHEYSLMQRIVESIERKIDDPALLVPGAVQIVHLKVGALDIHAAASFRQAFEVLIRETPFAGAALDLTIASAYFHCRCGEHGNLGDGVVDPHQDVPYVVCPKCGLVCAVLGGRGIMELQLTVAEAGDHAATG